MSFLALGRHASQSSTPPNPHNPYTHLPHQKVTLFLILCTERFCMSISVCSCIISNSNVLLQLVTIPSHSFPFIVSLIRFILVKMNLKSAMVLFPMNKTMSFVLLSYQWYGHKQKKIFSSAGTAEVDSDDARLAQCRPMCYRDFANSGNMYIHWKF